MYALTMRFEVPDGADWEAIREMVRGRAEVYAEMPDLVSKAFVIDEGRREYGGNYVWETKEAAERFVASDTLRATISRLGWGEPELTVSEVVAYVDRGRVVVPAVTSAQA